MSGQRADLVGKDFSGLDSEARTNQYVLERG